MDMEQIKQFVEQNKKACVGGLAGAVVVLLGIAVATSQSGSGSSAETAAASTEAMEETTVPETAPIDVTRGDFYNKLTTGNAVNILVLGDGFAYGDGASDASSAWAEQLSQKIGEAFHSANVFVNNYALSGNNGIYSGYVIANELNTDVQYDAVILSFGSYDDDKDSFGTFYEALIRSLNKKFPGIEVLSLIEPSSETDAEGPAAANAETIKTISSHYLGETIDIAQGFKDAGKDASETAAKDKINQNDEGNNTTADVIVKAIQTAAESADESGNTTSISPLNAGVSALETCVYIPSGDFAKLNDTTFEILADYLTDENGNAVQGLLGLDYDYLTGDNDVYVTVDGQPFGRNTVKYDGAEAQQHIVLINDGLSAADHVTIRFATKEEADTFAGMTVSGNVTLPASYDQFETMASEDSAELSAEELLAAVDETNADGSSVLLEAGALNGEIAEGGPGAAAVPEGAVSAESTAVTETTAYSTTNETRYNNGVLEEKYGGEWWEVETEAVVDANAGVYAAGQDHPGSTPTTGIVRKNAKVKTKSAGPGGDSTSEETTVAGTTTTSTGTTQASSETTAETTADASNAGNFSNPGAQVKAAGDYSVNETDAYGNVVASNVGRLSISSSDEE